MWGNEKGEDLGITVLCGRVKIRGSLCYVGGEKGEGLGLGFDRWSCDLEFYFYKSYFNKEKAKQQIRRAFWFYRNFSNMYKPEIER